MASTFTRRLARWLVLSLSCACSSSASPPPSTPAAERGFLRLDAETIASATGQMFYAFFPADDDPTHKPLFVFFNGGPGAPTTTFLLADGTAPKLVDARGAVATNPASFTSLGNILYLDQRQAGLSYDDAPGRPDSFDENEDAVDFTRSIVRFLDGHAALQGAPVVLVGESYGGGRAQLILDLALEYAANPTSPLHAELQSHFDAVFPKTAGHPHAPTEVARQFVAQVLIEPSLGAYQIARSSLPALTMGQCGYDTRLQASDPDCRYSGDTALAALADPTRSASWLGGPLEDVAGLRAAGRHGFRLANAIDETSQALAAANAALAARLGTLDPADAYFGDGATSNQIVGDETLVPPAFVGNLRFVHTFITRAAFDATLDPNAIAAFLTMDLSAPTTLDEMSPAGAARPGSMTVSLPASSAGPAVQVVVRYPEYQAGHHVTQSAALEFHDDVGAFLTQVGVVR